MKSIKRMDWTAWVVRPLIVLLAFTLSGCETDKGVGSPVFLLETDSPDVVSLAGEFIIAISIELEESDTLEEGFPRLGQIELLPDPSNPGMQTIDCASDQAPPSKTSDCILLNEHGDFVRAQAITWESAAFYMYRIYVAEKGRSVTVNPAKDFVALDVFVFEEPNLWHAVDQAIRTVLVDLGARPNRFILIGGLVWVPGWSIRT